MNDDELRTHLRDAVEPVRSAPPPAGDLRAAGRRRARAARLAGAGLAVVVLAAAGVGIAVASRSDGPTGVVAASPTTEPVTQTAAGVTVGCMTGAVTIQVGQTLTVTGCTPEAGYAVSDPSVLRPPGSLPMPVQAAAPPPANSFFASAVGTTEIALSRRPACNGGTCPDFVQAVGTITVTVVPGQGAPPAVEVPCAAGSVTVLVGQVLHIGCASSSQVHGSAPDTAILQDVAPPTTATRYEPPAFRALRPGREHVALEQIPFCAGTCNENVPVLGVIEVLIVAGAQAGPVDVFSPSRS